MVTKSDRREIVEKLEITRQRLMDQALNLPEPKMTESAKDGDRTPKGMLLHIASAEVLYRDTWALRAREENQPDLTPNPSESGADLLFARANKMTTAELIQFLKDQRTKTLRFIGETTDEEFNRKGMNTPFGNLTVHQFLKSLYRHDQMHIDEIAGTESQYIITTRDGRRL